MWFHRLLYVLSKIILYQCCGAGAAVRLRHCMGGIEHELEIGPRWTLIHYIFEQISKI
jgi:hypothetical protein